ncbi:CDP-diacylglycerol-inositol 3-phosphatidyltransferase [Bulinus truncatus]|nr:CDP-diacylglycerol-inositol 3-phosphatidyltransferase [Bulinus truncatus]
MGFEILLYVPNIIGYVRIVLAVCAFMVYHDSAWFTFLYSVSISLDGIDGYLARKLQQCTAFGAWCGYLISFLEWLTFMSTHSRGERWKLPEDHFPWLVKKVMAEDLKTPLGIYTVGSLHLLPLWIYVLKSQILAQVSIIPFSVQVLVLIFLIFGRLLCSLVELFYIKKYVLYLLYLNDKVQQIKK